MKNCETIILMILFSLFLLSCENISDIDQRLEHEELFVVSSQISGGDINPEVSFTKSLPLNTEFDISKAELKDITAYIKVDDGRIFPLEYIKDGIYKPKSELEIISSKRYELFALANETRIYGTTVAPSVPELIEAKLTRHHISCEIMPEKDVVYSCIYVLYNSNYIGESQIFFRERDFFSVEGPFDENAGSILIRTGTIPQEYQERSSDYQLGVEIYAWDKSYKKYFETKGNNKAIDDVFSQGGGAINWNVSGENVIGMFIGFSTMMSGDIANY